MYILNQVVQSCLANARKHTYHGQVVARFEGARDGRLVFAVVDTGAGLPRKIAYFSATKSPPATTAASFA